MASSSTSMAKTYDVFVSFRGVDIRNNFLSHLQDAFRRNGIIAFVDEELERGAQITSSLMATIEDSYISIVIFSENYVFSTWCLDELVKILHCKNNMGQIVIPVFYYVDPTDVQDLSGKFGDAIVKHREDLKDCLYKVDDWCHALKETAELAGLVSHSNESDPKLIDKIINHISEKLFHVMPNSYDEGLVGIDSRIKCVESLLCFGSSNVNIVGIWGMGGIGKSTLAKKVYDQIKGQFTIQCFVEDVRERFENGILDRVQNEILCAIFGPAISNRANCTMLSPSIALGLRRRKVCIILDDVNDIRQIENSIGKPDIFGPGSIVIITSRDKQLLRVVNAKIYEVEALNNIEALHLFCLHAFKRHVPEQEYEALSKRAIRYAQGNPLALKLLGSNLYCRSIELWEDELDELDMVDDRMEKILRISYDGLQKREKEIFLYTACFFIGRDIDDVVSMLGMARSKIGVISLCDKSLVSITERKLHMHDLLKQMAKEITLEEKELGKRMILWQHEDVHYLLTRDEGSGTIKGISLDMSKSRDLQLKPTSFERFYNLRYLEFKNSCHRLQGTNKVHVPEGLIDLPSELRLLYWDGCPLKSLPSKSFLENLVELQMWNSKIEQLWSGDQELGSLKFIDLSGANKLRRLPDFSKTPNLKILDLTDCTNLRSLPENLGNLKSLIQLDLRRTSISELPLSICNLESLERLFVGKFIYIHDTLGKSKMLYDPSINQEPSSFDQWQKSWWIYFDGCEGFPCLEYLAIDSCGMLEFPKSVCSFTSLTYLSLNDNSFESIPETIKQLTKLEILSLYGCNRLQYLPELPPLVCLYLTHCTSLKSAFGSSQSLHKQHKLQRLDLGGCTRLNEEECNRITDYAIASSYPYQVDLCIPGSEMPRKIKYKNKSGSSLSISFSFKQLKEVSLCFCVVFNPKLIPGFLTPISDFSCKAIFQDELGHNFDVFESSTTFVKDNMSFTDQKHVLLWHESCNPQSDGRIHDPCTILFNFSYKLLNYAEEDEEVLYDAIAACGIHPLWITTPKEEEELELS